MTRTSKVIISYEYPPIPVRNMDYAAFLDGDEESGRYGWGATPSDALRELADLLEEDDAS